jgi:ketosteroid isomerase-like protein
MADDAPTVVRRYYDALDGHDYDALGDVLAPDFVQHRPDRTFDGRDAFVRFMREERPMTETRHDLRETFVDGGRVAVRGRLLDGDGSVLFGFVDVFALAGENDGRGESERRDDRISRLETYTK